MRRIHGLFGAGMLALALGSLAAAAPPAAERARSVQAVYDCRKITDDTQRLACYDAAVAAMTEAEKTGDLVSLDRSQRQTVRKQAFGFALPSLDFLNRGESAEALNRDDEVLASASQDAEGKWTFRMQSGAVWRQIDDEFLSRRPHEGSKIEITRAMMGSFMLRVDGQPGVRVHRDA
jgi:hypothetical protein